MKDELEAFIVERLQKYPPALQPYIPTILAISSNVSNMCDVFRLLFCGLDQPLTERNNIYKLDYTHLMLDDLDFCVDGYFSDLFETDESYLALVNQIVRIIFPR